MRTWGNSARAPTCCSRGPTSSKARSAAVSCGHCPRLIVLRAHEWDCPVIPLLADEIVKDVPGQEAVLDRLLDLLLIAVLRAWFARPDADAPGWYRAPRAIRSSATRCGSCTTTRPTRGRWRELAHETGVSRAALARRFHELVGEPPMAFLTNWRIALAADLLLEPGATIGSVAHRSGTAARSRSAPPSSACAASARSSTAVAWRKRRAKHAIGYRR